jgi:hypothetical protein
MGEASSNRRMRYVAWVIAVVMVFGTVGFLQLRDTVLNVSAVEIQQNIGVYWDSACTQRVSSIDWGTLIPGQTKTITLYVRNEGNSTIQLVLTTGNYNPSIAFNYISLDSGANNCGVRANEAVLDRSTLTVSPLTRGISGFSFVLVVSGGTYVRGDLNGDGRVDIYDSLVFASVYGTTPDNPRYLLAADFDRDGLISIYDGITLAAQFP